MRSLQDAVLGYAAGQAADGKAEEEEGEGVEVTWIKDFRAWLYAPAPTWLVIWVLTYVIYISRQIEKVRNGKAK